MKLNLKLAIVCVCFLFGGVFFFVNTYAKETKTVITGNEMEIINAGDKVVYSGNSKVVRGDNVLKADKIVQNKKDNMVEAQGNVDFSTLTDEKEKIAGSSENGEFNMKSGKGRLWNGHPTLKYFMKTSTVPVVLEARSINFNQKTQEILAAGDVVIISSSMTAYSPQALFKGKIKQIILTGNNPQPRVIFVDNDKKGDYHADKITMYADKKKIYFEDNVSGKIFLPDEEKTEKRGKS